MITKGLKPALLLQGEIYWLAWDEAGKVVFSYPQWEHYLVIQGRLENLGYYDIAENSALAASIRSRIEDRQNNW